MGILQNQDSDNAGNNDLNEIQYFLINKGNDNFPNSKVRLKAGIKEDLERYMKLIEREVLRERTLICRTCAVARKHGA